VLETIILARSTQYFIILSIFTFCLKILIFELIFRLVMLVSMICLRLSELRCIEISLNILKIGLLSIVCFINRTSIWNFIFAMRFHFIRIIFIILAFQIWFLIILLMLISRLVRRLIALMAIFLNITFWSNIRQLFFLIIHFFVYVSIIIFILIFINFLIS
jgi:hypothetical protein